MCAKCFLSLVLFVFGCAVSSLQPAGFSSCRTRALEYTGSLVGGSQAFLVVACRLTLWHVGSWASLVGQW